LTLDPVRSGIGRLSKRRDLTVLAIVFCFGALLNAFGMVAPVYELQSWMADVLGTKSEGLILGLLFFAALVVEPFLLLALAGWIALRATRSQTKLVTHVTHFAWSLVPLGFGVWIAHYAFHLLTGLWTFVPVAQKAVADLGLPFLGTPDWGRGGLHESYVRPIEMGFLALGLFGSLGVAYAIAQREFGRRALRGFLPWAALLLVTFATAVWLLTQPMEMRGTFL
jgi:hypothetical protein